MLADSATICNAPTRSPYSPKFFAKDWQTATWEYFVKKAQKRAGKAHIVSVLDELANSKGIARRIARSETLIGGVEKDEMTLRFDEFAMRFSQTITYSRYDSDVPELPPLLLRRIDSGRVMCAR